MAQLRQVQHASEYQAAPLPADYAAAISRQRLRLISNLSGGRTPYESLANPGLPTSMTEPVSFDDSSDEHELIKVRLKPVDESEDDW